MPAAITINRCAKGKCTFLSVIRLFASYPHQYRVIIDFLLHDLKKFIDAEYLRNTGPNIARVFMFFLKWSSHSVFVRLFLTYGLELGVA